MVDLGINKTPLKMFDFCRDPYCMLSADLKHLRWNRIITDKDVSNCFKTWKMTKREKYSLFKEIDDRLLIKTDGKFLFRFTCYNIS